MLSDLYLSFLLRFSNPFLAPATTLPLFLPIHFVLMLSFSGKKMKKTVIALITLATLFSATLCAAQGYGWAWIAGSTQINDAGSFSAIATEVIFSRRSDAGGATARSCLTLLCAVQASTNRPPARFRHSQYRFLLSSSLFCFFDFQTFVCTTHTQEPAHHKLIRTAWLAVSPSCPFCLSILSSLSHSAYVSLCSAQPQTRRAIATTAWLSWATR